MKRVGIAAAVGAALCATVMPVSAASLPSLLMQSSQVAIAYVEPGNPDYRPIYGRLQKRQVLEELQAFLAPLRLPRKVLAKLEQCGALTRPYEPDGPVTICYEYVAEIEKLAPTERTERGVSRQDAIVGAFVQIVLHEMAHAVFDVLEVPVWGREADAADKLAAFLMMQFGTEVARRTLNGAAYFFETSDRTWTGSDFSDVMGTDAQRFYNYLCVAYGGNPEAFKDFVAQGEPPRPGTKRPPKPQRIDILPRNRAQRCPSEYADLRFAFGETILPHVDEALLQEVLQHAWLRSEDGQ